MRGIGIKLAGVLECLMVVVGEEEEEFGTHGQAYSGHPGSNW